MSLDPTELALLTAPAPRTAIPSSGTRLCVTWGNNMPNVKVALTGANLYHAIRFPYIVGPKAAATLFVDLQNFVTTAAGGDTNVGNSVFVDSVAIETLTATTP